MYKCVNIPLVFQRNLCCEHQVCIDEAWKCARGGRVLKITYELECLGAEPHQDLGGHFGQIETGSRAGEGGGSRSGQDEVELGLEALDFEATSSTRPKSRFTEAFRTTWKALRG